MKALFTAALISMSVSAFAADTYSCFYYNLTGSFQDKFDIVVGADFFELEKEINGVTYSMGLKISKDRDVNAFTYIESVVNPNSRWGKDFMNMVSFSFAQQQKTLNASSTGNEQSATSWTIACELKN